MLDDLVKLLGQAGRNVRHNVTNPTNIARNYQNFGAKVTHGLIPYNLPPRQPIKPVDYNNDPYYNKMLPLMGKPKYMRPLRPLIYEDDPRYDPNRTANIRRLQ